MDRVERINREARALWIEVFGEPPKPDADPSDLLRLLLEQLEPTGYSRLSEAAQSRNLVFPERSRAGAI